MSTLMDTLLHDQLRLRAECDDEPQRGRLTEAELDAAIAGTESAVAAARRTGCSINCDQGRRCSCAPAPAEAATEVGAEDSERDRRAYQAKWARRMLAAVVAFWSLVAAAVWIANS